MRSRPSECETPRRFFKFIPPGCISKVSIPIAFRKYLKCIRKTKRAVLKRGNRNWPVKINDDWVFGDGWEDFVRENDLQDCEFVTFEHEGDMVFDTMVFDLTWCEKESPTHDLVMEKKTENAILEATSSHDCKVVASRLPMETTEVKVIQNPCFKSIIAEYGIKNNYVDIPLKFARENKLVYKNCKSVVMDEKRRKWPTTLCSTSERVRIRGLRKLWAKNRLKKGDHFLLEVVDNGEKPLMNLHKVRELLGTVIL